ncbi:MAG TPA: glycoside hydrolase family 2 TIM barrel-domain containing protein, partial [Cyclobacteriaceae bacterium]|nr:glycoside hydrolase family 2 TIM barrel-domain containing protein [Cyclobacteriaceae bacterium]
WVRKMLIDIPKSLRWNAMRICVGIVPDFWYDLADEFGIMFQNEWMYWQNHGWDEQVRNEYTDWVWSDGNHPSIVIWDAINENWDDYIGNKLIPELKILDPSRIWDAGYMTSEHMKSDEMDEPHPYRAGWDLMNTGNGESYFKQNPYLLGKLDNWPASSGNVFISRAPQLVNEYGWIWLWRDGRPSKLTKVAYDYLLGPAATPDQRRELQAYWLQLETEWLRAERSLAGVLAFCYLANNYGFTGDWFIDNIKDLKEGPALKWMKHSFAPTAVFIDLPDERYIPYMPVHKSGEILNFKLACINDLNKHFEGKVRLKLINSEGKVISVKSYPVTFNPLGRVNIQASLSLTSGRGGYLVVAELETLEFGKTLSRRYIRVGEGDPNEFRYYEIAP